MKRQKITSAIAAVLSLLLCVMFLGELYSPNMLKANAAEYETVIWPVPGVNRVTSRYGWRTINGKQEFHYAIDIGCSTGTNVVAVATGKVVLVQTGYNSGMGNRIVIDHGNSIYTGYQHLNQILVSEGDIVAQGQVIAKSGATGAVSGAHLDFHVKINGDSVITSVSNHFNKNPLDNFLPYDGQVSTNGETVYIKSTAYTLPKYGVDPTPHLTFSSDCSKPSGKLEQGKPFGISGSVSSYPNLNRVWGGVYYRDGTKTSQWREVNPQSTYCNLAKDFDPYIIFNDLPVGYYTYKIEATTTNGQYKCIQSDFQIGDPPPSTYTVTLNANGGSVSPTSITVSANGTYSGLTNPSKTGYTFTGWYTSDGTKKENGSGIASNSNHTLTARWTANNYKVVFNANGGSGSMNAQTLTYDQAANLTANAFSKTGYSFAGWNTKSDGSGTSYANKASVKNLATSGTVTLYAQWSAGGYTIVYNANGGSGSMDSKEMKYDQTANLTANAFTAPIGYSFSGWNTKADGSGTSYADKASVKNLAASGTVTLYARWTANKYTIKFDGNGADELSKTSMEVTYNSVYGEFPEPKREGYNFIGWYTQPEGGTAISPDTKVTITSTQTLYAQWSQVKFLITFNATGGTSESAQKLVTYDKAYGVLPTAERTGYTFKGWYLDEACTQQITSDTIVALTANQSVYAKWEIRKYVITFDATGGVAERDSKQVTYGKTYGVLPSATKDGDEFIGWFTEDGIEITSVSIVEIEYDTTLYAKWASDEVIGDVNADGAFNVADVVMMQKWLLCAGELTDWQVGDLCKDERIDVFDLCLMKRLLIKKEGN